MSETLEALLAEGRTFPPPPEFRKHALDTDVSVYDEAERDWLGFWATQALALDWAKEWDAILEWDLPFAKWFVGGKLNVAYNCLDRHVEAGHGDQVAYHWEGEPGDTRVVSYRELLEESCRVANLLRSFGVEKGDRAAIYLGMVPEIAVAMLACARIGAPHSVVFGGFSAQSLVDRINDAQAKVLVTADGAWRRGAVVPLKAIADEALAETPSIERVLVLQRTRNEVAMRAGRDVWWHDAVPGQPSECAYEEMDSEDLLYLLYTSGTTGKPKGIMHTTGGYLTQCAYSHKHVFDLHPDTDVFWCTADVGWVTGHSYIVYGPLANRTTSVLYEGTPDFPDKDRLWSIVEKYEVTTFYTAPTAIRTFMKWGDDYPARHDLSSIRLLGTVGEPINPEAWVWYYQTIGGARCPVVDTWWQTETGAIMISPLPGATTLKPGSATFPLPGIRADVVDDAGNAVGIPGGGYLVLERPWPSMLRGIWGDPQRYRDTYWSRFDGKYFAGDGAKRDEEGYFWLLGRVDDIMLVSGHNISTTEVESALVDHPAVAEAAVVGKADETTGQAIAAFVILRGGIEPRDELVEELRNHVAGLIGPIAKPKSVLFTDELPKTRSGKIMRRLLRDVAQDQALGDTTTLADPAVVDGIKSRYLAAAPAEEWTRLPEHWTWRAESLVPRRAVVVDIDGVLSDASRRQHYLESPRRDWRSFFDACGEDRVIEEVRTVLELLDPELQIVLLTARPHRVHHLTEAWLRRYDIRWDLLIMRPWGDYELARDFKELTVWELRAAGFDLRLAFEDDRRNVEMFRAEGIPCLYVHSGYYD